MPEQMPGANAHEGCVLFGYVDVSRAPGTLHVAPHSARHSFDFSKVNAHPSRLTLTLTLALTLALTLTLTLALTLALALTLTPNP